MTRNPNVHFEVSSTQVAPHERVAVSWEVEQANKVYFYTTGQNWVPNQVALKGVRIYYPTIDTAYNLRVVNSNNTVESYKIEVIVDPPSRSTANRAFRAGSKSASGFRELCRYQVESPRRVINRS